MAIRVTSQAWSKMSDILRRSSSHDGFLYSASSGGCNGFNFKMELLETSTQQSLDALKFKTILTDGQIHLYIDPLSEMFLRGTTVDYLTEDYSQGQFENKFVFHPDKDLLTTCGCGVSFTPVPS